MNAAYWTMLIVFNLPTLTLKIQDLSFKGLIDAGTDVTIITKQEWHLCEDYGGNHFAICKYQINMYTLNQNNVICQLYLNKTGENVLKSQHVSRERRKEGFSQRN